MKYSPRILDAFEFMHELHGTQTRKCGGAPYITHLLAVAALVGEYGGDEDQFIGALFHDTVEDQGGENVLRRIRQQFGERVGDLVWACTDAWESPKPPWRERKEAHIARIPSIPEGARLILAADKIHNLQSMLRTYTPDDPASYWRRFNSGRDGALWYYEAMGAALAEGWEHPILAELEATRRALEARVQ